MGEADVGDYDALDRVMEARRNEVRKRWVTVARAAGMSVQHLSRIRTGKVPLTDFAARGLDSALEWPAGTAMAIYLGSPGPGDELPAVEPGSREWWEDIVRRTVQLPPDKRDRVIAALKRALAREGESTR